VWRREELAGLRDLCEERDLALIFDEVFSEHLAHPVTSLPRPEGFPLAIVLNGLSKMLSLPTWKIGWMAVTGDVSRCAPLCRSLEHMADTFLAVGELQQAMVPDLLRAGDSEVIAALAGEIGSRRTHAIQSLVPRPISPEGGVHLCCSLPDSIDDEEFALELLERHHVSVHPGHYYDLPHHFVMTCVATPEDLTRGAEAINRTLARRQTAAG
jgi:aspartate/methionine/tyrosine aminotransferase